MMTNKKKLYTYGAATVGAVVVIVLCASWISSCSRGGKASKEWPVMGTTASVTVNGDGGDAATVITKFALEEVNAALSVFEKASDISALNRSAGKGDWVPLGKHAQTVLAQSAAYHKATGGAFNPAIGALMETWGFARGAAVPLLVAESTEASQAEKPSWRVPSAAAISNALAVSDMSALVLTNGTAHIARKDMRMRIDLGAIAKGYGVDVAFERLVLAGFKNFMVNVGGNIRCAGQPAGGDAWRIAVRDPMTSLGDGVLGTLMLTDGMAVATSGNYEQYFEHAGTRYTHIMDPRTGWPVTGVAQVTVVAASATEADALSTSCFVLGPKASAALLAAHENSGAMFVSYDAEGRMSTEIVGDFWRWFVREPQP